MSDMEWFAKKVMESAMGRTHLFFLGQAGFVIKNAKGQLLAIDPYLSDCVERVESDHIGYKRLLPKILEPDEIELDILVCTHFHRDHYDVDAVPTLMNNGKTILFCPIDCKEDIDSARINNYTIVEPGISVEHEGYSLHFINCDHGTGAPKAVGVIIETDGVRILVVGDSSLRLDRKEEYLSFGNIDLMIAPINGKYGNLDESDFIQMVDALNPQLSIPCHYGMFTDHGGSILSFYEKMRDTKHAFLIMAQGEEYIIN